MRKSPRACAARGAGASTTPSPTRSASAGSDGATWNPTRRGTPGFVHYGAAPAPARIAAFGSTGTGSRSPTRITEDLHPFADASPSRTSWGTLASGNDGATSSARIRDDVFVLDGFSATSPRRGTSAPAPARIPYGDEFLVASGSFSTGSRSRRGTPASTRITEDVRPFAAASPSRTGRGTLASGNNGAASSVRIRDLALDRFSATSRTCGGAASSGDIRDELEMDRPCTRSRTRVATTGSSDLDTGAVAASTTILDLSDHLLQEIFRLLPDVSSIFSASSVCRSWHRILTAPVNRDFLLEILGSYPPPLLGFYLDLGAPHYTGFASVLPHDPILSGILESGDFLLDRLSRSQEGEGPNLGGWEVKDCQNGYLLLSWSETEELVVYEPLKRYIAYMEAPQFIHHYAQYDLHLVVPTKDSARVVCVCHMDGSITEISVCDVADKLGWRRVGRIETASPWSRMDVRAVQAEGKLFWPYIDREKMCGFDVFSYDLSWIEIPPHSFDFKVEFTDSLRMLLVSAFRSTLNIWEQSIDEGDGRDSGWNLKTFALSSESHSDLMVISVQHGFAYLCALQYVESSGCPWVLFSLCIRTGEIQMIIETDQFAERVYPFHVRVMARV